MSYIGARRCVVRRTLVAANALRHRGKPDVTHGAPACGGMRALIAFHHPQAGVACTISLIDPTGRVVGEYDSGDVAEAVQTYMTLGTAGLA